MAPHLPFQPLNDLNGLNPSPSHRSYENHLLWSAEVVSGVNFQLLTGQYPQHGHAGQFDREQLMAPQILFQPQVLPQPRSIQNTHHDHRWLEEEEVLQRFRDGHDHEGQARFGDSETQFGRDVAQLFRPFAQIQHYRDEQLNESQELRGSQEMLAQLEEQMEQGGLGQQRDGTIPSIATGFVHQRFQDVQNHQSPYDAHNLNAASSQVYFQQQQDQHGRRLTYRDIQHGGQDRRQKEGQPLQMGSSHVEGHKWKGHPSDDGVALLRSNNDWSHLPPTRDYPPLAWAHHQDEEPYFDSLPEQMAYSHPDQQVQQSFRVAAPVPSSRDSNSPSLWQYLPRQAAYGQSNHIGQQSTYSCQPEQVVHGQQPIRDSTPPRIQSRAATPIPSNPPGMDLDSMAPWQLRLWNNTFDLPSDRNRGDLIKQAKTGKPVREVKRSKQKKRDLKGFYAGYAVEMQRKTDSGAANKHSSPGSYTQAFVSPKNLYCSSTCHRRA